MSIDSTCSISSPATITSNGASRRQRAETLTQVVELRRRILGLRIAATPYSRTSTPTQRSRHGGEIDRAASSRRVHAIDVVGDAADVEHPPPPASTLRNSIRSAIGGRHAARSTAARWAKRHGSVGIRRGIGPPVPRSNADGDRRGPVRTRLIGCVAWMSSQPHHCRACRPETRGVFIRMCGSTGTGPSPGKKNSTGPSEPLRDGRVHHRPGDRPSAGPRPGRHGPVPCSVTSPDVRRDLAVGRDLGAVESATRTRPQPGPARACGVRRFRPRPPALPQPLHRCRRPPPQAAGDERSRRAPHVPRLGQRPEHHCWVALYRRADALVVHHQRLAEPAGAPSSGSRRAGCTSVPHQVFPTGAVTARPPDGPPMVLFFGALRPNKGLEVLDEAMRDDSGRRRHPAHDRRPRRPDPRGTEPTASADVMRGSEPRSDSRRWNASASCSTLRRSWCHAVHVVLLAERRPPRRVRPRTSGRRHGCRRARSLRSGRTEPGSSSRPAIPRPLRRAIRESAGAGPRGPSTFACGAADRRRAFASRDRTTLRAVYDEVLG